MRLQPKWTVVLLGLLVFAAVLGSFAPAGAQQRPQLDFTPVAHIYLPLVESGHTSGSEVPPIDTPSLTPTSYPAPPTLLAPVNGVVLTQPVGSNEWLFHWEARTGPCHSTFSATGPNGYSISAFVYWQDSSPGSYSYHYTRTVPFPADAVGLWTWQVTVICPAGSAQSGTRTFYLAGDTSTPTPIPPTSTPTATPTSQPGPPVLLAPANGAVLQQPIDGNEWRFQWQARTGPCHSSFKANGPNGYAITAQVYYTCSAPAMYSYRYTRTVPFPADAFGRWTWQATVICPMASAQSETRTFYFQDDAPTPTPYTPTPTPTSTAVAGPPVLLAPANGAVLQQPIDGNEWVFRWQARMGPCHSSFKANGPNGYALTAQVYYSSSAPGGYSYYYTRTVPFPTDAFGRWTWQATVICPLRTVQSETWTFYLEGEVPTPTPTSVPPTPTPTATPTSQPGPPTLIAPANGAVLKQPTDGNEWLFHWNARTGPCHSSLSATGPSGYSINAFVDWQSSAPGPYSYHYTRTVPFPAAAFGRWTWQVMVICPAGSAQSETRTFYVE